MSAVAAAAPPLSQHRENRRAILAMIAAVGLLSLMDGALKLLSPHYPPMQVAALRGMCAWPLVFAWVLFNGGLRPLVRIRWPLHLLRGLLSVVMLSSFIFALRILPLAEAYAIFFVSPLLITALSVPILRERIDLMRWLAIAVGLLGVLIVLKPSGASVLTLGGLATLVAATAYAISAITVRVLSRTDNTQSMVFWMTTMLALGAGALASQSWVAVRGEHWLILLVVAVTGALGQYAITEAFRRGQASVVAPFEYTALVWAVGLDWALWQVFPTARVLLGAAVIAAAGVYLMRREREHPEAEHP